MEDEDMTLAILGEGWQFPPTVTAGQIAQARYDDDVRQAILIIVGTNRGERPMRPEFGANLRAFVFEPMSVATLEAMRQRVRETLIDWEPRIDIEEVTALVDPRKPGIVQIGMAYHVRATNSHANLVYPFYLDEGTAP